MTLDIYRILNFIAGPKQVAQLSQRNRAAGWVSFVWVVGDGLGQTINTLQYAPNAVGARKLKALIFYVNPLLYEKWSLYVFEPLYEGLGATYAVHLRLIGKPLVVVFLLVIIKANPTIVGEAFTFYL